MKGEFVGVDGKTYHIDSIALKEVCSEPSTTISGSLDGGARLVWKLHLHPSHPDFPAAVAALQALIQPSLDPEQCCNCRFWGHQSEGGRFINGWCRRHPPAPAFPGSLPNDWCGEYERERG